MDDNIKIQHLAASTVHKVLQAGAKKPRPCHWKDEDVEMHLNKAIRHICTHRLMRDGHQEPNGENHLELALTRVAMALYQM